MAKKIQKKIHVKNPKIGKDYYFYFAGGIEYGKCVNVSEKLTSHYGFKYYTFEAMQDYISKNDSKPRMMRYPVAIHDIRENKPTPHNLK
jgi:hypothetical protein